MDKTLLVYGAGGLGREVISLARAQGKWEDYKFMEDDVIHDTVENSQVVSFAGITALPDATKKYEAVVAVGEPSLRIKLIDKICEAGIPFATIIHPSAQVADNARIGAGVVIGQHVFVSRNACIGENTLIQPLCMIGHDVRIGTNVVILTSANLAGNVKIGSDAFIGMGALVKQGVSIGANTMVSMAAAVFHDLPEGVVAVGNPARVMGKSEGRKVFS